MLRLFIIFGVLVSQGLYAQYHPILDRFTLFEREGKVYLTWTITKGQTCIGTQIYRSTNDYDYELIHTIGGICGFNDRAQTFDFVDENPIKNTTNYYKLFLDSGITEPSLSAVVLDIGTGQGKVVPNPLYIDGKLYFENDNMDELSVKITTSQGQVLQTINTRSNSIDLRKTDFSYGGVYLYTIQISNRVIANGSFTVH
ncbi:MAG: T9SS type A sorting domain-containing protein [Saprospiraceae bacterium]